MSEHAEVHGRGETYGDAEIGKPEWGPPGIVVWSVVFTVIAGSIVVGLGLVFQTWWVFWLGWGVMVVALLGGKLVNIMEYTEEYVPSIERAARGDAPWESAKADNSG